MHWRRYLELDLGSPWAKIARAHLEEGASPPVPTRRPTTTDVLLVAAAGASTRWPGSSRRARAWSALIAAPGNPGIAAHARCLPVKDTAVDELVHLAREERPDLVVVGPEAPLAAGLADRLRAAGFAVFGRARRRPSRARRPSPRI